MRHRNQQHEIVIISGFCNESKVDKTFELEQEIKRFPNKSVYGVYKGAKENSLVVILQGSNFHKERKFFLGLLKKYEQDCLLYVTVCSQAYLIDRKNKCTALGKFTSVPRKEALKHDNYTYDYRTNSYYVASKKVGDYAK